MPLSGASRNDILRMLTLTDSAIDDSYLSNPAYAGNALAIDWARTTKVCEESGEVWRELSLLTGENERKSGTTSTKDKLVSELGDVAVAALLAIQHHTKSEEVTWFIFQLAVEKVHGRALTYFGVQAELRSREVPAQDA